MADQCSEVMENPTMPLSQLLRAIAWIWIKRWVRRSFPDVPELSTQALADWLAGATVPQPVLVDVRKAEEFAVSHLPQACHATTVEAVKQLGLGADQPVVLYCSIGYRSARLGAKLRQAGFTHIHNLEGSIFQWANEGRPLVNDVGAVSSVHPYNPTWGLLLNSSVGQGQLD
jgi:rhodanese-related sulfurtransferase